MQETEIGAEPTESARAAGMRATMYAFLAAMFNQRPDRTFVNRLNSFDVGRIRRLAEANDLTKEAVTGLSEIAFFVESIDGLSDEQVVEMLAIDWTRLFRGVAPNYGPKPPYEAVYVGSEGDESGILKAVMEKYMEHGMVPERKGIERPDYIGVELDFLALLAESEKEAWRCEDSTLAQAALVAAQQFLLEHFGRWVGRFCDLAIEEANTGFYRGVLMLTQNMVMEIVTGGVSGDVSSA